MESSKEVKLRKLMARLRDKARRKVPEADAEDLVQEVLVVLVERMKRGQVDALQAYAEGILRHMVYDYYQRKKERMVSLENTAETEAGSPSPEQRVVWMRHLRVIDGLAQENPVDRALVDEHFVKGSPLREVASQLKVSPGVVNGRLFRFRQKVTQRVGSCFAMFAAVLVGLWSRITSALMVARTYSTAVGMLSVGTFATWMWWPQAQQPVTPPSTKATHASQAQGLTAPDISATPANIPSLGAEHTFLPTLLVPASDDNIQITPVALPRTHHVAQAVTATNTAASAALHAAALTPSAKAPSRAAQRATQHNLFVASAAHFYKGRIAQGAAQFAHTVARTNTAQANAAAAPTKQVAKAGSAPQTATAPTPSTGTPNQPGKGTTPVQPGVPNGPKANAGQLFKPTLPGAGVPSPANTFRNASQTTAQGHTQQLPGNIILPTKKRSFCVVQDGRIYRCGGTKMTDITGPANSPFTCGMNKRCTQLIGAGPSLLFTNTGELYLLGEHLYRKSDDGGDSWHTPAKLSTSDALLASAEFILQHSGALWQQTNQQWQQARTEQTSVHEVRVHLDKGQVNFEDDTGFQVGRKWSTSRERQIVAPAPSVPNAQPQQTIPNVKPDMNNPMSGTNPLSNTPNEATAVSAPLQ